MLLLLHCMDSSLLIKLNLKKSTYVFVSIYLLLHAAKLRADDQHAAQEEEGINGVETLLDKHSKGRGTPL